MKTRLRSHNFAIGHSSGGRLRERGGDEGRSRWALAWEDGSDLEDICKGAEAFLPRLLMTERTAWSPVPFN